MGLFDRLRRQKVVETVQKLDTDTQVGLLSESLGNGNLQNSALRKSLEKNAPIEMRKGIVKLVKRGKVPTVDLLLEEYRGSKSFQKLAFGVGLDEAWFVKLAEDEIKKSGMVNLE